ncbi:MAG: RsiV family protein [Pyrinomonadaceae bacterium]
MRRLLFLTVLLGCAFFAGLPACSRKGATSQPAVVANNSQPPALAPEVSGGQVSQAWVFAGSIGGSSDLQMKLVRTGHDLSGTYSYLRIGKSITLKGTIDKDGNITLSEFDATGAQTGVFKGKWDASDQTAAKIEGAWSKPNSDKQAKFSLAEQPISLSGGLDLVTKSIKESDNKLKYDIAVLYPQLSGSSDAAVTKFNSLSRGLVSKKITEFKKDMAERAAEEEAPFSDADMRSDLLIGHRVALASDDLVSIGFDIGGYARGAAHPYSYSEVINYDLKSGKVLKLADLFKPSSNYLKVISTYCHEDLKKQGKAQGPDSELPAEWLQRGTAAKLANFKSWTISRKGLVIVFDSYQVGPYALGPQFVSIPYPALKDVILSEGPLGQFVK